MNIANRLIECVQRAYSACCVVYFLATTKIDDSGYLWWATPLVLAFQMVGYFFVAYLCVTALEVWEE